VRFADGKLLLGDQSLPFSDVVAAAYAQRVQLWSDGFYATPGLSWDKTTLQGKPFHYFAYGAAVSEVIIDTLSGEWRLLRADLLHDVGTSLNPAIDLGQIEGGFIQGMGWLTTEELVWHPDDGSAKAGLLMTHAPSTYKIPTANDCPAQFNTRLYQHPPLAGALPSTLPNTVHHSKAVGEPPLLLAFSVFFAIRDAIAAVAQHRFNPPLQAPATSEAILQAVMQVQAQQQAVPA
jgi:xanthine dehydrogenase large subunit